MVYTILLTATGAGTRTGNLTGNQTSSRDCRRSGPRRGRDAGASSLDAQRPRHALQPRRLGQLGDHPRLPLASCDGCHHKEPWGTGDDAPPARHARPHRQARCAWCKRRRRACERPSVATSGAGTRLEAHWPSMHAEARGQSRTAAWGVAEMRARRIPSCALTRDGVGHHLQCANGLRQRLRSLLPKHKPDMSRKAVSIQLAGRVCRCRGRFDMRRRYTQYHYSAKPRRSSSKSMRSLVKGGLLGAPALKPRHSLPADAVRAKPSWLWGK